jgi:hypothetical protein
MARFTVYAEVLTSEHPQMKAFASGVKKKLPGQTLREILQRNGGAYEAKAYFTPGFREQIRQVAELTSDDHLLSIAEFPYVAVSLDHLRRVDPETRIVVGCLLTYEPGESERLGLVETGPPDPRTTFSG